MGFLSVKLVCFSHPVSSTLEYSFLKKLIVIDRVDEQHLMP